jgi:hypothetical protein
MEAYPDKIAKPAIINPLQVPQPHGFVRCEHCAPPVVGNTIQGLHNVAKCNSGILVCHAYLIESDLDVSDRHFKIAAIIYCFAQAKLENDLSYAPNRSAKSRTRSVKSTLHCRRDPQTAVSPVEVVPREVQAEHGPEVIWPLAKSFVDLLSRRVSIAC